MTADRAQQVGPGFRVYTVALRADEVPLSIAWQCDVVPLDTLHADDAAPVIVLLDDAEGE